ncbi:DUF4272 domain-containing protein [Angelakisella massiliensis]|uniref:DUF4272 domain-containing protein n=1 Tax=Angelakisella massiliensis TaxID=1871018 RepID=UPI0024B259E0|nr:DUF4272 domain-containing protein [Angelakisella massiliensis]
MAQIQLNLYTPVREPTALLKAVQEGLAPFITKTTPHQLEQSGQEMAELELMDGTALTVRMYYDPVFLIGYLAQMVDFFRRMETSHPRAKAFVLSCVPKFQGMVSIRFETTEEKARTNCLMRGIFMAAARLDALTAAADGSLYQPDGRLLLGASGDSQVGEEELEEFETSETAQPGENGQKSSPTSENRELLAARGIDTPRELTAFVGEHPSCRRTAEEIAHRASALFAAAVCAETIQNGAAPLVAKKVVERLNQTLGGGLMEWTNSRERAYLEDEKPPMGDTIDFAWKYEACQVLLWVLGHRELSFPDRGCNATGIGSVLWNCGGMEKLLTARPHRTEEEIWQQADLTFRCQWACRQAAAQRKGMPGKLNQGVVYERAWAFRWLLGDGDWEDMDPNRA